MTARRAHTGTYAPKNPEKYLGNHENIVFRSSWERAVFRWCDTTPSIIKWSSEELCIPYFDRGQNKQRRYYPDVLMVVDRGNGRTEKILVEIKPSKETVPPTQPKKMTQKSKQRYLNEMATYVTNQCKWEAAEKFCRQKGMTFMVLTEEHIFTQPKRKAK